jgi:hypothetical protein
MMLGLRLGFALLVAAAALWPLPARAGWRLEPEVSFFEAGLSRALAGGSWAEDFDQGWRRSGGLEAGLETGARLRRGPWEARARWRARWGEFLPARGRWLEAALGWRSEHLALRVGREPIDWGVAPQASLLVSRNPPPLDHAAIAARAAGVTAESFLAYLDDRHRAVPYPLLWGMRLFWEPREWLRLEAQRTILLGGGGRTRRLTPGDLWDIFLGSGENAERPGGHPELYPVGDTDQKFAWQIRLWPRAWARRRGLDDLEAFWLYAGEDRFRGLVPTAPGRAVGLRVHPSPRWAASFIHASTVDDRNFWYHHKLYGYGYTYRGFVIGVPMGGDATLGRVSLHWLPEGGPLWSIAVWRERRGFFRDGRGLTAGGYWGWRLSAELPVRAARLQVLLGGSDAWGGDRATGRLPEGLFQLRILWGPGLGVPALGRAEVWGGASANPLAPPGPIP